MDTGLASPSLANRNPRSKSNVAKKPGRKPKSTDQKRLEGNPGKRELSEPTRAQPLARIPAAPSWLGDRAKSIWNETATQLMRLGLILEIDLGALAQYCQAWQDYFDAKVDCEENGEVYVTKSGSECERPAVWKKNRAIKTIETIGARFGLTPDDRRGMNIETDSKRDNPTNPLEAELGEKT